MATEALVEDQTAEGHAEEVKLTNDVKDVDKESMPEFKDLEGKDEERIKVEDAAGAVSSATEPEDTISEEKQEIEESDPVTEEVKNETEDKTDPVTEEEKKEAEDKTDPVMEEVKKEAEDEKASDPLTIDAVEKEEIFMQEVDPSTAESKEEADSSATVEPTVEVDEKELENQVEVADTPEPPKPPIEASEDAETAIVQESESETAKEPAVPEAAAEEVNATPVAAVEEVTTEELQQVYSLPETGSKEAEQPVVSAVTEPPTDAADDITTTGVRETAETSHGETISAKLEESTEPPKEEPLVTESNKLEEVSDNVPDAVVSENAVVVAADEAPVKELKEEGEEAVVTEEVPNVSEFTEGDKNTSATTEDSVSTDTNPAVQNVECFVTPKIENGEELREKAAVSEEPTISGTTETNTANQVTEVPSEGSGGDGKTEDNKEATAEVCVESSEDLDAAAEVAEVSSEGEKASEGVEEKKDENLEGGKATSVETSRDIDAEADNLVGEKTEKEDEKTPAESAKDAGEAPKTEVPAKSSQRQSSNIFSKVKQSIVKVKKAIVGKSPSSKAMSAEGKDEIKVK